MLTVNIHEAKTHFSRLVDRAHAGETIIIAKNGKPWAELMPTSHHESNAEPAQPMNRIGILAQLGIKSWAAPDWKDNSDIIEMLENKKFDSERD